MILDEVVSHLMEMDEPPPLDRDLSELLGKLVEAAKAGKCDKEENALLSRVAQLKHMAMPKRFMLRCRMYSGLLPETPRISPPHTVHFSTFLGTGFLGRTRTAATISPNARTCGSM